MGLTERRREGAGEDPEFREVLLKVGDPDGQSLRPGVECGESFLHLSCTTREMGNVFGELSLERKPRPPKFEPGQGRDHRAHEGQQGTQEDQS